MHMWKHSGRSSSASQRAWLTPGMVCLTNHVHSWFRGEEVLSTRMMWGMQPAQDKEQKINSEKVEKASGDALHAGRPLWSGVCAVRVPPAKHHGLAGIQARTGCI